MGERIRRNIRTVVVTALAAVNAGADAQGVRHRAAELFDRIALEIEPANDPELSELLSRARTEVNRHV